MSEGSTTVVRDLFERFPLCKISRRAWDLIEKGQVTSAFFGEL